MLGRVTPVSPRPCRSAPWLLAAALLGAVGCIARPVHVSAAEQQSFGARTFPAAYDVTFAAARDALPLLGYGLEAVDVRTGRITTERIAVGGRAEIGFGGPTATPLFRRYDLHVQAVGPASTRVVAVPHMLAGERDVSRERVWTLDGPSGEHARWRALFEQIEVGLRSRARVGR